MKSFIKDGVCLHTRATRAARLRAIERGTRVPQGLKMAKAQKERSSSESEDWETESSDQSRSMKQLSWTPVLDGELIEKLSKIVQPFTMSADSFVDKLFELPSDSLNRLMSLPQEEMMQRMFCYWKFLNEIHCKRKLARGSSTSTSMEKAETEVFIKDNRKKMEKEDENRLSLLKQHYKEEFRKTTSRFCECDELKNTEIDYETEDTEDLEVIETKPKECQTIESDAKELKISGINSKDSKLMESKTKEMKPIGSNSEELKIFGINSKDTKLSRVKPMEQKLIERSFTAITIEEEPTQNSVVNQNTGLLHQAWKWLRSIHLVPRKYTAKVTPAPFESDQNV